MEVSCLGHKELKLSCKRITDNMNEQEELNGILGRSEAKVRPIFGDEQPRLKTGPTSAAEVIANARAVQWSSPDGRIFIPTSQTINKIPPGFYEIGASEQTGLYFSSVPINLDNILRFPDSKTDEVLNEIALFWDRREYFQKFGLTHKRGILLWGPPGSGKTTTLQLISKDVIERNGIVLKFDAPHMFQLALRKLREVQPDIPVVVLMEDLDAILDCYNESTVINILDGVDKLDRIVFMATTNYPERLGARIINRPSRFDKKYKIGFINAESRKLYFEFLAGSHKPKIDIDKWVADTEGFSIAHLKELFTAVVVLENKYEDAMQTLKLMAHHSSSDDDCRKVGFLRGDF